MEPSVNNMTKRVIWSVPWPGLSGVKTPHGFYWMALIMSFELTPPYQIKYHIISP